MERNFEPESYRKRGIEHLAFFEKEDKDEGPKRFRPNGEVYPSVLNYGEIFFYRYAWEWYFRNVKEPGLFTKFDTIYHESHFNKGTQPTKIELNAAITRPGGSPEEIGMNYLLSPEQLVMLVSRLWFGSQYFQHVRGEIFEQDLQNEVFKLCRRQKYLWNRDKKVFSKKLDEIWPKRSEALNFLYDQEDLPALACELSEQPKKRKVKK